MGLPVLEKLLGKAETRPARDLEKRLEKLLRDIEHPKLVHPAKYWIAKEVQKTQSPILLTIPFDFAPDKPPGKEQEFAVVWAQNRRTYGIMLFAGSQYPTIDYDLWAYTRAQYRGHNIAKFTLAEGLRQLALQSRDVVLTAEILIENERTRQGAVRWLKALGFIASASEKQELYKRLFLAAYPKALLAQALQSLPSQFQQHFKKMPPLPPDILAQFTTPLTASFDTGGSALLDSRRKGY